MIQFIHSKKKKKKKKKIIISETLNQYAKNRLIELDEEDEEYLKECWDGFLKYFDTDHTLTIGFDELGKKQETVGYIHQKKVNLLFNKIDP